MAEKKKIVLKTVDSTKISEKPTKENPTKEKPTKENPTKEKPTKEKPTKEKPTKEKPTKEKPMKEKPTKEKPTKEKSLATSIRLELNLEDYNESGYVIVNYPQLLEDAENKQRKNKKKDASKVNHLSALDDDDDDKMLDVARYFEAKYGNRKGCDYEDLGAGYDEEDSFIDNTDAYDEMVPEELTTAHGGFYINSGVLEFKDSKVPKQNRNDDTSNDGNNSVVNNPNGKGKEKESSDDDENEEDDDDDDDDDGDDNNEEEEDISAESEESVVEVEPKKINKRARSSPEDETKKVSRLPKLKTRKVK